MRRRAPWSDDEFADHTLRRPLLFEPGTRFLYSNPGYWLLKEIVSREADRPFEEVLKRDVLVPLGLESTRMVYGQFADDLPWYPSGWVWHGVVVATASDMACFMASPLVEPLRQGLAAVDTDEAVWKNPHYGYGLMLDPGICYGHGGEGPGYAAACFHFEAAGLTGCVLTGLSDARETPFEMLQSLVMARG